MTLDTVEQVPAETRGRAKSAYEEQCFKGSFSWNNPVSKARKFDWLALFINSSIRTRLELYQVQAICTVGYYGITTGGPYNLDRICTKLIHCSFVFSKVSKPGISSNKTKVCTRTATCNRKKPKIYFVHFRNAYMAFDLHGETCPCVSEIAQRYCLPLRLCYCCPKKCRIGIVTLVMAAL